MKKNILFIIFFLPALLCFPQSDTVLLLTHQNSLGGQIVDTSRHYTIWQKHYAPVSSGRINKIGNQFIMLDSQKIFLKHISKIRLDLNRMEKRRMTIFGVMGIVTSVALAFYAPYIDFYTVPMTISSFVSKGAVYRIPPWRLQTIQLSDKENIIKKEKGVKQAAFIIFNNLDTVHRHCISFDPVKLFNNTVSFSFEFKNRKKTKHGNEFEAGYFYPDVNIYGFVSDIFDLVPNYYYQGIEMSYLYKKYHYAIRPDGISLNYYGAGIQYRYISFDDKWYYGHDEYFPYDSYLSQEKKSIGISFRNGTTRRKDESTIEYYIGIGGRIIICNTEYHFYKSHASNTTYIGPPPYDRPANDHGMYFSPYVCLGIKLGLSW